MAKSSARYDHGVTGLAAANWRQCRSIPRTGPTSPSRDSTARSRTPGASPPRRAASGASRCMRTVSIYSVVAGPANLVDRHSARTAASPPIRAGSSTFRRKPAPSDFRYRLLAKRRDDPGAARADRRRYDYSAFAARRAARPALLAERSRTIRPRPAAGNAEPEEYAVGFAGDYRNTNGGVALGYGYGPDGTLAAKSCEAALWTHGAGPAQRSGAAQPARARRPTGGAWPAGAARRSWCAPLNHRRGRAISSITTTRSMTRARAGISVSVRIFTRAVRRRSICGTGICRGRGRACRWRRRRRWRRSSASTSAPTECLLRQHRHIFMRQL